MKKIIILLFILTSGILKTSAQPNAGFENWFPEGSYENPQYWQTFNFLSLLNSQNPLSAFKATGNDKHSGNYALKLKTVYFPLNPLPDYMDDTTGGAYTGKINPSPLSFSYGFPYTGRPENMEFWAKYLAVGGDTAAALVYLQKWNDSTGARDTIALGLSNIISTPDYTLFSVNIIYRSTELPDTAAIVFVSSKYKNIARVNSTLFIDDVSLNGWVGVDEQKKYSGKVKSFPNPASDEITIVSQFDEADHLEITDVSGKLICSYKIQNYKVRINTSAFADGIYFHTIHDKKDKILFKGKFNVMK